LLAKRLANYQTKQETSKDVGANVETGLGAAAFLHTFATSKDNK
jgi:hypothetical protein